jgi:hypothetical protein
MVSILIKQLKTIHHFKEIENPKELPQNIKSLVTTGNLNMSDLTCGKAIVILSFV